MKDFLKYTLATLLGLFLFSAIGFVLGLVMMASIIAMASSSTPSAPLTAHSVYRIEMRGSVQERLDDDEMSRALLSLMDKEQDPVYGLDELLANIRFAAESDNVDGIYLDGGSLSMGPATAQAIREELLRFQESGKWIVAYADAYEQSNYYLASVADYLYVNPAGALDWHGMSMVVDFYSRLLKKVGVEMQVVKVGTFKSAVEPFILTEMSEANRLQYQALSDDLWQERLEAVSASRDIAIPQLNSLADRFMALQPQQDYVTTGLVDSLCYTQDVRSLLIRLTGEDEPNFVSYSDLSAAASSASLPVNADRKIAVLYAEGDITDDKGDGIVGKEMVKEIDRLTADSSVVAVVLRVNSGGGSAFASEQIHHALTLLRAQKPLVVSMGDYAASGGYYISCCADSIFAMSTTLTGSIGIFGLIPNVSELADKVGLDFDGVKTNQHADLETNMVLRGMSADERALMQAEINRGYDLFVSRCAEGRHISEDSIRAIGEGRVWSGTRALEIGLVDRLGSLDDAIEAAASLAGVEDYDLVAYPEPTDPWLEFLDTMMGGARLLCSPSARAEALLRSQLSRDMYATFRSVDLLRHANPLQARLPYVISIR